MTDTEARKSRQWLLQLRPFLPLLALLVAALALWLAWSGWQQLQDHQRRSQLMQGRDMAAQLAQSSLQGDIKRMQEHLAAPAFIASVREGDFVAAGKLLAADWPQLDEAEVLPIDLSTAYAALPDGSFGRVAALEAALVSEQPVVWVMRDDKQPWIALTSAVKIEDEVVAVALARLPLSRATGGLESVSLGSASYLALRQGGFTLLERGNLELSDAAERLATPVTGTSLRVVAAAPHVGSAPFGLSGLPLFAVAVLLLLLAYWLWRWLPGRLARAAEP